MAFHYFFDSKTSIENITTNLNNHLNKDGLLVITLFDGDLVNKLLDDKDTYTSYYLDEDNIKTKLFEIKKVLNNSKDKKESDYNLEAIDVHMSWISEDGVYNRETLLTKDYLEKLLLEKCNLRLIDTDYFMNLHFKSKSFFNDVIQFEENAKMKKYFYDVNEFFKDLKGADKESIVYSNLHRYYIFQKF